MATTKTQDITALKGKVIQAALDCAAETVWTDVTLGMIARKADCSLAEIQIFFMKKDDILHAYGRQVDARICKNLQGSFGTGESEKDKLFDIMMERFEILNENRTAVISVLNSLTLDPAKGFSALPWVCESVTSMADLAGVDTSGLHGMIRLAALGGIYMKTLRDWVGDDSPDLAATMSGLDHALGYFEAL